MDYSDLITKLEAELATKQTPGPILDEIMFRRLKQFGSRYEHNHDLLMTGALLGDIRIDEARTAGDKSKHVEMALDYLDTLKVEHSIPKDDYEIIYEVVATHHGGEQNHIESKIYKNADNFKFLEARGCFHFFGAVYNDHTSEGLLKAVEFVKVKLDEKLKLTDLDQEALDEARTLHDFNLGVLERIIS